MQTSPRAAVDVGSNSIRLLVVDGDGGRLTRQMAITRLAAGVDATGHLDDAALERSLETISGYRDIWREHGVTDRVRIAATSAVRDANDRDRFFQGVREATGIDAQVITGVEEASLAFAGAARAVDVAMPTAVIDIGGGSTELIVGDDAGLAGSVSLQLGCVRLTERCLLADPVSAQHLVDARAFIDDRLDEADARLAEQGVDLADAAALIGVAGTATTLAALHLGLGTYEESKIHGSRIPTGALADLSVRLVGLTSGQRAELGPMQPGREDVIHGGGLILAAVLTRYGFDEVVVSEADNLDGLVASLA
ncbi:MAG: Ppx/GppA family phosphatase [Nitriliruptor sp.]|nr:MAG: Ppx/GppA family phosphatase [Nitriliruptor sp.]